jgi:hypothetical protein
MAGAPATSHHRPLSPPHTLRGFRHFRRFPVLIVTYDGIGTAGVTPGDSRSILGHVSARLFTPQLKIN